MQKKYLLGFDIGSSSIKASLVEVDTGKRAFSAQSPEDELSIQAPFPGWAEQTPASWWHHCKQALGKITQAGGNLKEVLAVGISYQMHGLVMVDQQHQVIRDAIIWCDSRAVETGERACQKIGQKKILKSVLNSPGNFTASKLSWVREHEPEQYQRVHKIMLPGDYIAAQLTGDITTTVGGLSEGILWDFARHRISDDVTQALGIDQEVIPDLVPVTGIQGRITPQAAKETALPAGTPVTYRAGDQPNNALSLNVFHPGELAATAGTSGVIYGILDQLTPDPLSRVNLFAHVNHQPDKPRLGVLLCINGTGIQYSWIRNQLLGKQAGYEQMNRLAASVPPGSAGIRVYPFGNGAERVLQNENPGATIQHLDFNRHSLPHVIRAAQEGIVYALNYGFEVMQEMGVQTNIVRAGSANMFLSTEFSKIFATVTHTPVELYDTDGATGAARAAGIGAGIYANHQEAFRSLKKIAEIGPVEEWTDTYEQAYDQWKTALENQLKNK